MRPGGEGPAVATGIIVFFVLVLIEAAVAHRRGRRVYRLRNAISNLGTGGVHGLANAYYAAALAGAYELVRTRFAPFPIENMTWMHWVGLLFFLDFLFYWNHRLLHKNRYLWCAHVVHHQSTDYNFTVSLRVSILQVWYTAPFAFPLALAGFPVAAVWTIFIVDKFYQFWVHTKLIGSLGPLEWVLVTPRHHSVHHAKNPEYIDRNFGGMFIIWDRLFGTFAPRRAEPVFGIERPLPTFNPVLANVEPWQRLVRLSRGEPETSAVVPPDALPLVDEHGHALGSRSPSDKGFLRSGLRLFAPVTVLLTFLYTQGPFSSEWVIITLVATLWLHQLGRFLDDKKPSWRADVVLIAFGAIVAASALGLGLIRLPVAIAIAAGCVMLIAERLVRLGEVRARWTRRNEDPPVRLAA